MVPIRGAASLPRMLALVRIALSRPYTFVVVALLIFVLGTLAALRMPVDIFPSIDIPIIGVAFQYTGLPPGSDGRARHHPVRARVDHHGERHRAYRGQFVHHVRHRQDLLPSDRQYRHRQCAGNRDRADAFEADAARRDTAADPQLQRLDGAHHSAGAVRQGAHGAKPRGPRAQFRAHAAGHGAGRRYSVSVRRKVAAGHVRPRYRRHAVARPDRTGRRRRARRPEPSDARPGPRRSATTSTPSTSTMRPPRSRISPTCRSKACAGRWCTCTT